MVGKTNTHELAMGGTTNNKHYGPTRNPWHLERIPEVLEAFTITGIVLLVGATSTLAIVLESLLVLAGLDLVAVHAKQGNAEEVLRVASHLLQVFQLHNVRPEALVALCMVQEAAERRELNRGILAQAAEILRANQARTSRTD